jgi:hypothetical protein
VEFVFELKVDLSLRVIIILFIQIISLIFALIGYLKLRFKIYNLIFKSNYIYPNLILDVNDVSFK